MTRWDWKRELLRWALVACAVFGAFYASICVSLWLTVFSEFPEDLADPTAGFLMGLLVVLTGMFLAPRYRFAIGFGLALLIAALTPTSRFGIETAFAFAGSVVAMLFVAWLDNPQRSRRSVIWIGSATGIVLLAFLGTVYSRSIDRPAFPDPLPIELVYALGAKDAGVSEFYRYDLGGFIDREWLWRIDADADAIAAVISGLGMNSVDSVPQNFWQMRPYYWPRSMPKSGEAFESPWFEAETRGQDGQHYFLVYDKAENRAFVWVKDNF